MGVPLADVEGVTVRRRARDAPDTDAAAGAADISITTDWPSVARIRSPMIRAAASVDPPGGKGTTSVMGRDG